MFLYKMEDYALEKVLGLIYMTYIEIILKSAQRPLHECLLCVDSIRQDGHSGLTQRFPKCVL